MKKYLKIIIFNFISIILLYVLIEFLTGISLSKNKLNCSYLLCNANYSYLNTFTSDKKKINYKKDKYGFRGRIKKINEIDIITVGGSTTDERYLNIEDTWANNLEYYFKSINKKIDVVNAGVDGQSTYGHIWNFENWFKKIIGLRSKYIIYYLGINEHNKNVTFATYKDTSILAKIKIIIKNNNGISWKLYNYINSKKDYLNVGHIKREASYQLVSFEKNKPNKNLLKLDENFEKKLITRLDKIKNLTFDFGSIPIFITQRTLRWKIEDNSVFSIDKNINYYEREKLISDIIMQFCKTSEILCVDLFSSINFETEDSYDLVHLNSSGSKKVSKLIFQELKDLKF